MRALSDVGMVPKGGPGGRKRSAHFEAIHLANVILALAGAQPSDGPSAVATFSELRSLDTSEKYGDWLAAEITYRATAEGAALIRADIAFRNEYGVTKRDMTMSDNPPSAWISELRDDGTRRELRSFRPADRKSSSPEPSMRRMTTIKLDLLKVAGELLADTLSRQSTTTISPDLAPGRAGEGDVTPETTKAAGPGSHNGLRSEQPALAQTESLNKAKVIALQAGEQSAPSATACQLQVHHQPVTARTRSHGTPRTITASP